MDHAVVMAGGSGTRFWPESRARRSKQFLNLTGGVPMIRETLLRLFPVIPPEHVWIVAGIKDAPHLSHRDLGIPKRNILLEPEGKNTAPAMAYAAAAIAREDQDAVVLATPADHAIGHVRAFQAILRKGLRLARETGRFVTLGVPPTHPSTGYGYIERGKPFPGKVRGAFEVARFAEKPDLPTAKRFLRSGRFDWNSGLFLFSVATFADRLAKFLPEVDRGFRRAFRGDRAGFRKRLARAYRRMPSISVDYGILEKETGILVLPAKRRVERPRDVALASRVPRADRGERRVRRRHPLDCRSVLVRTDSGVAAVLGMDDVVVIRSGDAVLVCPRSRSEEVKGVLEEVRRRFPALA